MNYVIKRCGKKVPKALMMEFPSYDKARQAIRKWVLKQIYMNRLPDNYTDLRNRTVTIGNYGFSIQRDGA